MQIRLAAKPDKGSVLKLLDELGEEVNKKMGYSPHNAEAQKVGGNIFDEKNGGKFTEKMYRFDIQ